MASANCQGRGACIRGLSRFAQQICCSRDQDCEGAALEDEFADRWGVWEIHPSASSGDSATRHVVRLCIKGTVVQRCFSSSEAAIAFQRRNLSRLAGWPKLPLLDEPARNPTWDHPEELEPLKQYTFKLPDVSHLRILSEEQRECFRNDGFLLGIPVLDEIELAQVRKEFEELLASRIDRAQDEASRFRVAHTLSRPLHQDLVYKLANHEKILGIVEDVIGPRYCCWSAHLFCKLPGDPTTQPWHQDAGFWPLTESRALTVWLAFDDVDASNSSVTFVQGSHRLGRLPWQTTGSTHHLLTQEIPDVDLLGRKIQTVLRAGEVSVHSDLTIHGSSGNCSERRRAGLALRFVGTEATCLGAMINGYQMNEGCILPRGNASDPKGHWRSLKKRGGSKRRKA